MYSILLETPEFIEKQYSYTSLERAQKMFELAQEDTDESDFTLYLVEHNEGDDPTDLIEEGKGILGRYSVSSISEEHNEPEIDVKITPSEIIKEVRIAFKPLGMRGKYYNLVDVIIPKGLNDKIYCIVQSRLNPELYIEFYSEIIYGDTITFKAGEEHRMYRLSQGIETNILTAKDLEIFTDMLKYTKDMVEGTEIEVWEFQT